MSPMIPPRWNILESERGFDARFFSKSPYRSHDFLLATILLSLDLGLGCSIGLAFWPLMPTAIRGLYVVTMIGLPVVWLRMRRDHGKMRAWCASAPPEARDTYPVRAAAHLMNFAPYHLYVLVLFLLVCLLATLRNQAKGPHHEALRFNGSVGVSKGR